jgi:PAS domain S-box-containing protein
MALFILDCAPSLLDVDGRVVNWNAGAKRITGYCAVKVAGQHFAFVYPRENARSGKPERKLAAAADKSRFEDRGSRVRKDRTRFWTDAAITAMKDGSGEFIGFVTVIRALAEQNAPRASSAAVGSGFTAPSAGLQRSAHGLPRWPDREPNVIIWAVRRASSGLIHCSRGLVNLAASPKKRKRRETGP